MEPKVFVYRNWDELVFEKRNKAYGAYALRKSYSDKVLLGLGVSVVIIAILLTLQKLTGESIRIKPPIPLIGIDVEILPPPIFEVKPKQEQVQHREQSRNDLLPPLVTSDPVPDEPVAVELSSSTVGDFTGEGVGGTDEGQATGTIEPPVIDLQKEYLNPEVPPAYEGGMEAMMNFLRSKIKYPASARRMGIEGTVFVSFLVKGDGELADVKVLRGIHPDCDKEAVRVVSMLPGWKGGRQGGFPVNVRMALPIKFTLK
jgi:protein TonB